MFTEEKKKEREKVMSYWCRTLKTNRTQKKFERVKAETHATKQNLNHGFRKYKTEKEKTKTEERERKNGFKKKTAVFRPLRNQ